MCSKIFMTLKNIFHSRFFYFYIGILSILFIGLSVYYVMEYSPFGRANTLTVTNLDDSGPGSFRAAVLSAFGGDVIEFDSSLSGGTITLLDTLTIGKPITATAEGNITITGPDIPNINYKNGSCLYIGDTPAAHDVIISGFIIENCAGDGINISDASYNNVIGGDTIAERNIIINNGGNGINFGGDDNIIKGNYIGLEADGTTVNGNSNSGIIFSQGSNNIIGGPNDGEENYIVGNQYGISFSEPNEGDVISNNKIYGNIIGLAPSGAIAENTAAGVSIASDGNYLGDDLAGAGNIISGNSSGGSIGRGIVISGDNNIVKANIIGLAGDGVTVKANGSEGTPGPGIELTGNYNQIGSDNPLGINIISGNNGDGILLSGENNTIEGNIIGLSSDGTLAKGNLEAGIDFTGASTNIITGNTISANNEYGIGIGSNSDSNIIILNRIGIGSSTVVDLGNIGNGIGISISTGSNGNFIGISEGVEAANIIAYNNRGISTDSNTIQNTIRFNSIFDNDNEGLNIGGISPSIVTRDTSILSVSVDGSFPNGSYVDFYYDDGNGEPENYINTGIVASSSASIVGPFTAGNYVVAQVTDLLGNSTNVSSRAVIFSDGVAPNIPDNLTAEALDGSVTLNWDDNIDIDLDDYNVYRSATPEVNQAVDNLIASGLTSSAYTDEEVINGSTYYYAVSVIDLSSNESDLSDVVSATPSDSTAPLAPANLVATAGDSQVSLDWADNSEEDFDHYDVYRSIVSGFTPSNTENRIANDLLTSNYSNTELINSTTYYYKVITYDVTGNPSASSSEASATPLDTTAPSAPANLIATAGESQVSLNWADNSEEDFDHYDLYRSMTSGFTPDNTLNRIVTSLSRITSNYTDSAVTDGTTYYYKVIAYDTTSNPSLASTEVSATVVALTNQTSPGGTAGDGANGYFGGQADGDEGVQNTEQDTVQDTNINENPITETEPQIEKEVLLDLYIDSVTQVNSGFRVKICADGDEATDVEFLVKIGEISQNLRYGGSIFNGQCKELATWELSAYNITENNEYSVYAKVDPNNLMEEINENNNEFNGKVTVAFYSENSQDTQSDQTKDTSTTTDDTSQLTESSQDSSNISSIEAGLNTDQSADNSSVPAETAAGSSAVDAQVEVENNLVVEGIPLNVPTEHASAEDSLNDDKLSTTNGNSNNSILVKTTVSLVPTQRTIADVENCSVQYYGSGKDYQDILKVYNISDKDSVYLDIDEDGLTAKEECRYGTNPFMADTDNDGLSDGEEVDNYKTNPLVVDTDNDKYADGLEIKYNTDPLDPSSYPDICQMTELYSLDSDNDGLPNSVECEIATDPESADSDNDGLSDGSEFLDYHSNPLKLDAEVKLQLTFPRYDAKLATAQPFFQGVAKSGEEVTILLQRDLNGENIELGAVVAGEGNKFIFESADKLIDGTYYVYIKTKNERSLPVRFIIDSNFSLDTDFQPKTLGGETITQEVLDGLKTLEINEALPNFTGKLKVGENPNVHVQLVWHSIVSGAIAIQMGDNISSRPTHILDFGPHDLFVSVIDAYGNQSSYIKVPFNVVGDSLLANFHSNSLSIYLLVLALASFVGISYYIHFRYQYPHAIVLSSQDIVTSVADGFHDKLMRKFDFKE
ncbi:MAG: hypothetical protein UR28_C0015G0041 [Candidatus Peregrinibacteria bacterium GW2011_GWF2_33_10]|nr:MAG: hypothetical protein UR28_C0015G0041 [Candidatus Peregrinibacteria bacterium GW2011_GWF2_33_10]